jgi:hypothetical protein
MFTGIMRAVALVTGYAIWIVILGLLAERVTRPLRQALGHAFLATTTLASVALGFLLLFSGFRGLVYDAGVYYHMGVHIASHGIFAFADHIRTYGFPLFLAFATGNTPRSAENILLVVFSYHLLLLVGVSFYAAWRVFRAFGSVAFARAVYLLSVLNPFILIHANQCLTDFLAALVLYLAFALSLPDNRTGFPVPIRPQPAVAWKAFAAAACGAFAAVVRPGSASAVPALALVWGARAWIFGDLPRRTIPVFVIGALLPFVPQVVNNYRQFGEVTPLIVGGLYASHLLTGMWCLKYGTTVIPNETAQLIYENPFHSRDIATPLEFFQRHPLGYLATLGLHLFGMLDQDFPFPYIVNLDPWYRWPSSMLNYAFFFAAAVGIGLCGRRLLRDRTIDAGQFACLTALVMSASSIAVYLPSCPEIRYALALYFLFTPFVACCVLTTGTWAREENWRVLFALALAGVLLAGVWARLSVWMQAQAPRLRDRDAATSSVQEGSGSRRLVGGDRPAGRVASGGRPAALELTTWHPRVVAARQVDLERTDKVSVPDREMLTSSRYRHDPVVAGCQPCGLVEAPGADPGAAPIIHAEHGGHVVKRPVPVVPGDDRRAFTNPHAPRG